MEENKVSIQWFPGHMTKAKRAMQEKINMVDMVIECRDARLPKSSENPLLLEIAHQKPRLIVLCKKDMADPKATSAWIEALSTDEQAVIALDLLNDNVRDRVVNEALKLMKPKFERWARRGIQARKIKAMVVGIPNVGKSTLINQLARKKVMVSADRPGVTMALKWANVHPQLDLLDTPGVLWPRFEDKEAGIRLALAGSVQEKVLPAQELAYLAFDFIQEHYPAAFTLRYDLNETKAAVFFEKLALKRGYLNKDGALLEKAYLTFLRDIKQGLMGPMSFEYAEDLA